MIKLKELLELNEMTYNDGADEKHQSRIDQPITLFEDISISLQPFPENSSKKTLEEVKYLSNIEEDREFVEEHDKVSKVFGKLHEELGLEFNKDEGVGKKHTQKTKLDGLNILHLSCLNCRHLSCLSSRHLSNLNSWQPSRLLLRHDRCLLLRQERCLLLCLLLRQDTSTEDICLV